MEPLQIEVENEILRNALRKYAVEHGWTEEFSTSPGNWVCFETDTKWFYCHKLPKKTSKVATFDEIIELLKPQFTLELDLATAQALKSVLAKVGGPPCSSRRKLTDKVFNALPVNWNTDDLRVSQTGGVEFIKCSQ